MSFFYNEELEVEQDEAEVGAKRKRGKQKAVGPEPKPLGTRQGWVTEFKKYVCHQGDLEENEALQVNLPFIFFPALLISQLCTSYVGIFRWGVEWDLLSGRAPLLHLLQHIRG